MFHNKMKNDFRSGSLILYNEKKNAMKFSIKLIIEGFKRTLSFILNNYI